MKRPYPYIIVAVVIIAVVLLIIFAGGGFERKEGFTEEEKTQIIQELSASTQDGPNISPQQRRNIIDYLSGQEGNGTSIQGSQDTLSDEEKIDILKSL